MSDSDPLREGPTQSPRSKKLSVLRPVGGPPQVLKLLSERILKGTFCERYPDVMTEARLARFTEHFTEAIRTAVEEDVGQLKLQLAVAEKSIRGHELAEDMRSDEKKVLVLRLDAAEKDVVRLKSYEQLHAYILKITQSMTMVSKDKKWHEVDTLLGFTRTWRSNIHLHAPPELREWIDATRKEGEDKS